MLGLLVLGLLTGKRGTNRKHKNQGKNQANQLFAHKNPKLLLSARANLCSDCMRGANPLSQYRKNTASGVPGSFSRLVEDLDDEILESLLVGVELHVVVRADDVFAFQRARVLERIIARGPTRC